MAGEKAEAREYFEKEYLPAVRAARSHEDVRTAVTDLLEDLFDVKHEEIHHEVPLECGFKTRPRYADILFGNTVFEIKRDLSREGDRGRRQLEEYLRTLQRESDVEYTGILTDGLRFEAYRLSDRGLEQLDELNLEEEINQGRISYVLAWLDRYLFGRHKVPPTAEDLKVRFGPDSAAFEYAMETLRDAWKEVKDDPGVELKFNLWRRHMELVYGSEPEENFFLEHTYLVTLVKLVLTLHLLPNLKLVDLLPNLTPKDVLRDEELRGQLEGVLSGEEVNRVVRIFEGEDFFTWILHEDIREDTLALGVELLKGLSTYDLSDVRGDFFKELYEKIVRREVRHRIGEYYTPDWLAELTFRRALACWAGGREPEPGKNEIALKVVHADPKPEKLPKILDPACGSGTFLQVAIQWMKEKLRSEDPERVFDEVRKRVVGIDLNPLAVIIARANYVLALGREHVKPGARVPVFCADAIRLPEKTASLLAGGAKIWRYDVGDTVLEVPTTVAKDPSRLSDAIGILEEAAKLYQEGELDREGALQRARRDLEHAGFDNQEVQCLLETLKRVLKLVDEGKDTIWFYVLSNVFAPVMLSEQGFDIVVGNPPWIAFRYIENEEYQEFVKECTIDHYGLLDSSDVELMTHMEVATLFLVRCADLYLRPNGIISFVLPRSVMLTGSQHHQHFRKGEIKRVRLEYLEVHDVGDVEVEDSELGVFNVPACVLVAKKEGEGG